MTWQEQRSMTPAAYSAALKTLHLNTASAARYLDISTRTSHRYKMGQTKIPATHAMLLHGLIELKIPPIVPPWQADPNKRW
jgi:hypothetical protein